MRKNGTEIAIVGMAGRFPGSPNLSDFWQNLKNGVESIRSWADSELLTAGVSREELAQPEYVKSGTVLQDLDMFDAKFFGFSPKDAAIMDPQHRVFLECAWEALEDAGHVPESFAGSIGVYAGSGMNSYMIHNLLTNRALMENTGLFLIRQTGNDKDVLATRVSYELDLRGPSICVQTACSTSLVAVHLACQSLLNRECDMALAGGVTIEFPHGRGYLYRDGEILSRDGHCRSFDADSSGTVFSSGGAIVALRRLEDALADHDAIHAVILGSAVNNDGARKAGYLAPSVEGQAEVIAEALGVAGIEARDVSYVETHGTGTKVGDPIEIRALTRAYRQDTQDTGFCAIGSLKSNIGHLDTAAGVAGLIKTVLALKHRLIPPSLHFHKPNPLIDFASSPFYVNTGLAEWKASRGPRRAGVTSLGIGGTNAHVVLEEALPAEPLHGTKKPYQLLVLSAKTESAVEQAGRNLGSYLQQHPDLSLLDVAYTCQAGRKAFGHRRTIVAATAEEAVRLLHSPTSGRVSSGQAAASVPGVTFMFSGQGSQHVNMGRELYETEPSFRSQLDLCAEWLAKDLGLDLRSLLYPPEQESEAAAGKLARTRFTQPALFALEYALAQWWIAHGVQPAAMIGHSIGEYVAACLSGVFSPEDGLHITAVRGRLMDEMPPGSMLSVAASPAALSIPGALSLAVVNGPAQCVVSGPTDAVKEFAQELEKQGIVSRGLHTSHAFHSAMMQPMLASFRAELARISLHAPKLPYISNLSGTWITASEATSPDYWAGHLRNAVQFSSGLTELFRESSRVFLEIGPGQALTSLARQHSDRPKGSRVFSSMKHPQEQVSDAAFLLNTAGQLWISGCSINWKAVHDGEIPQRIPLPTYPFERQRYWIEPGVDVLAGRGSDAASAVDAPKADTWFHQRVWKRSHLEKSVATTLACWLIFLDETGLGTEISDQLKAAGHEVLQVTVGAKYKRTGAGMYTIQPGAREDYHQLLADIAKNEHLPAKILHLWPVMGTNSNHSLDQTLDLSFYSLLFLGQALGEQDLEAVDLISVSNGLHSVSSENVVQPARATLLGPIRVIPKEFPGILCRNVDLDWQIRDLNKAASDIIADCAQRTADTCVAWRKSQRWVETFGTTTLPVKPSSSHLKEKGVYWITGAMGGIGLVIAEHLARTVHARLVLSSRTALPPVSEWDAILRQPETADGAQQTIRKLRELESLGSEVLTIPVDVTSHKQTQEALQVVQQRFGALNGVIHAAGLIEDGPLQVKTRESAARVLAPKVQGTLVLQEALRGHKLDFWLLFSSISSITPPPGQVDYAAANAFLDAFALSQTGQSTTAVNWSLWSDVGMATRDTAGSNTILGRKIFQSASEAVYSARLSSDRNWLVSEHRFKSGEALVPGTGYLQLASAAMVRGPFEPVIQFEDVFFLAPLSVAPAETKEVRVRLRRQRSGFRFSILANDKEWIEYASGQIARNQRPLPPAQRVGEIRARCSSRRIDFDDQRRTRQEKYFDFGPRWRSLRTLQVGEYEALAELQLGQDFSADLPTWFLHPALLDLATGCALYLIEGYEDSEAVYLPLSYKRIKLYRPIPAKFFSHIRSRQENTAQREIATFNLTLLDDVGQVLAEIEEFSLRRIAAAADGPVQIFRPRTPATYSDMAMAEQGISSADGIKAFEQILSADMPPGIIVAPGGLTATATDSPAAPPEKNATQTDREVEGVLAEWWQELLGAEKVELDDDFFDLGGHSLIALRLFNKIKKTFRLDLGLSTLFEARTVRRLGVLIRQARASSTDKEVTSNAIVPIREQGSRLPLFLLSGLGGEVIGFHTLARCLGDDQPVIALQPQGLDGKRPYLTQVEEMAAYYLSEIRSVQPHGPYCLAGYSFGGYVTFEMAQQLHAAGESVALLGFLDTIEWQYLDRVRNSAGFQQRWALRLDRFIKGGWDYINGVLTSRVTRMVYRLFHRLGRPVPQRVSTLQDINRFAMSLYRPTLYPGRLIIFRSVTRSVGAVPENDELLGWGGLAAGGIEVQDVPGSHGDMLNEPNVRVLAEKLQICLDRVQVRPPHDPPQPSDVALEPASIVG
ncbi:MAG TPA: SDR family NAD(P)-dependent oxidoreductase [Candidatus Dormibacteraeota bacterium]|nr:SDR family NAD(P)-dependent oxidoreductase [Candidatus Dormibacteraeota bacterium]